MVNPKIPSEPVVLNIRQVTLTIGKVIQPVQYEPIRVELTQMVEIEDGQSAAEVRRALYEATTRSVRTMMKDQLRDWRERRDRLVEGDE